MCTNLIDYNQYLSFIAKKYNGIIYGIISNSTIDFVRNFKLANNLEFDLIFDPFCQLGYMSQLCVVENKETQDAYVVYTNKIEYKENNAEKEEGTGKKHHHYSRPRNFATGFFEYFRAKLH